MRSRAADRRAGPQGKDRQAAENRPRCRPLPRDFYVPDEARWQYIKDTRGAKAVGDMLNKALGALEEANTPALDRRDPAHRLHQEGRPDHPAGQQAAAAHRPLRQVPAAQRGLRVPRPARRRVRVPDRRVRRLRRQEGRRVLHAARRRADDGAPGRAARRACGSTTRARARAAC